MNREWLFIVFLKTRISDIRGNNKDQFLKKQKVMVFPHLVTAEVPAATEMLKIHIGSESKLQAKWAKEDMGGNPVEEKVAWRY